jgi:uncharacterized protein YqeY
MALKETLQAKMTEARKAKNTMQLGVLSTILGEVSTRESKKPVTDDEVESIIRKIAGGNYTTLATIALGDAAKEQIDDAARKISLGDPALLKVVREKFPTEYTRISEEDGFICSLLPKTLSVQQIKEALASSVDDIKNAKNEGAATGVAMKAVKAASLKALGEDVKQAVKELRG